METLMHGSEAERRRRLRRLGLTRRQEAGGRRQEGGVLINMSVFRCKHD
jgi:hypothetical protein